ncbi:MAG: ferredoxin [Actinomycetota bacterium]|nr:ferredoxin [Actinomycetota bacterium]
MNQPKLHVDRVACEGRGLCIELLPELFAEDPWGYPAGRDGQRDTAVPATQHGDAEQAVRDCPRLALSLRAG